MHIGRPRLTRVWLAALAYAGMVAGHGLAFFVQAPEHHHREELLEATGHGNWWLVRGAAAALFLGCLALFAARRLGLKRSRPPRFAAGLLLRLAPLQVAGFLGLEAFERAATGELDGLLGERVVMLGLLIQIVVAALATGLLLLVSRAVRSLVEHLRPAAAGEGESLFSPASIHFPSLRPLLLSRGVRGPPPAFA